MPYSIDYYLPPSKLPLYWVHCWAIFAAVNFLLWGLIWPIKRRSLPSKPSFISKYRRIYWSIIFWLNVPWLLMGIGIVFGGVGSIINFGLFWEGNTIVLAWWVVIAALALSGIIWLNFGGAEELAKYPSLPMVPIGDTQKIKRYFVATILVVPIFFTLWQNTKAVIFWLVRHQEWEIPVFISVIVFLSGFAALMIFLSLQAADWTALVKHYRAIKSFKGKRISGQTSKLFYGVTGAVLFGFEAKALHLSFSLINRLGHPPISIPWTDVKSKAVKIGSFRGVRLDFKKSPLTPLMIPLKTAQKFRKESSCTKLVKVFPVRLSF